ncbi:hypothetical protein GQ43DRAFT_418679 [Delitschia confertaspora ATCC 74209]|uniref:RING-type E3 ubiquitin transferase n=1 Tax=Delitschia confertaspora ATCC 74209 TaxID=1513339 RepID=A0A9P4MR80_9PLEO|nr:hypothetical protein GQ43DRAFT_418679 [Delitschia confertaspora ATCC 74209]
MATTTDTPADTTGQSSPARRGNRGRGHARPPQHSGESPQEHELRSRGRGRGGNRGARRARGNRDGGSQRGGAHQGDRGLITTGKEPSAGEALEQEVKPTVQAGVENQDDEDVELCFICASPVQHTSVAPCNHRTCHICSLRLRALYKTKTCAHCRTHADHVIFTDSPTKNFENFSVNTLFKSDDNLGIRFENSEIFEDTVLLLRYNCPDESCDVACLGWPDLHRHVKTVHQKVMCDLCTRNKKVFTHEHELFTPAELKKHQKFGDDNPGSVDQSGFKGHPECGFCRQRFYGDDELYTHCRDKHERCHICDRRNEGRQQQYYVNYDSLEVHFRKDHFLCPDRECLEKKFVVFDSEIDLKAHQLEAHPHGLSKDARRDARRVDLSGFQVRQTHEQETGGRRDGRGRGRGRDPNSEPLPQSSAQTLRRDEVAFQRQMAIQNAQSATGRAFGGQLTTTDAYAARPPQRAQEPSTITASVPSNANTGNVTSTMSSLSLDPSFTNSTVRTPQEQARLLRHNAVTERAKNMLRNDSSKLEEFRSKVSAYRNSKTSAAGLIEAFFSMFDTSSAELGKLIKELADIFEIQAKRDDLLKAWNDWRAINEDYPSLPGATVGSLSAASSAHGGSRVLKLKSSTAQSQRSPVSQRASWSSASSSNPFPPLSAPSSSRIGARPGQTPWASGAATSSRASPLPSRSSTPKASVRQAALAKAPSDAFPALPAAPKPTTTIFSPGYSGGVTRRINNGTPVNAWSAASNGTSSSAAPPVDVTDGAGSKKKGNKKGKQTLFHFG